MISNSDQVGYINFLGMKLMDKSENVAPGDRVKNSLDYLSDIFEEEPSTDDDESEDVEEQQQLLGDTNDEQAKVQQIPHVDVTTHEEVDFSVPLNVEMGEQLSPNAFAKGIANMENRDSIPMPQNKVNTVKNQLGWLWLGGIQGVGTDIGMAMNGAMQELEGEFTYLQLVAMLKFTFSPSSSPDAIRENDFSLRDLVSLNLYVQNMDDYEVLNQVYAERLNFANPPIRVCVGVPLPKQCPIVMDALAFRAKPRRSSAGGSQSNLSTSREDDYEMRKQTMHVQGISHWAPANIGPYSQSVRVGDLIYVSGQIPLIPGTMRLIEGGIIAQCKLSLRHMQRIARAMSPHGDLRNVVQGTCFLTDVNNVEIARKEWEFCTTNAIIDYVIVKSLPRHSLVEWQVWLHTHNDTFECEWGREISNTLEY